MGPTALPTSSDKDVGLRALHCHFFKGMAQSEIISASLKGLFFSNKTVNGGHHQTALTDLKGQV